MADSVWVFGTNDDYKRSSDAFQMRVNTAMDDSGGQYQSNGLLALSETSNSTRFVFGIASHVFLRPLSLELHVRQERTAGAVGDGHGYL